MVYRLYTSHHTVDLEEIADVEMRQAEALERADDPEAEEVPAEGPEEVELREDTR
jgi:multicomponent Na+:H+ antiporter subunit C